MASDFADGDEIMEYAAAYATYLLFSENPLSTFTYTQPGSPPGPPDPPPSDPPGPTDDPPTENEFQSYLNARFPHMYEVLRRAV